MVGVSSLCLHLSVRCHAHLVSFTLPNKAVLGNDSGRQEYLILFDLFSVLYLIVSPQARGADVPEVQKSISCIFYLSK